MFLLLLLLLLFGSKNRTHRPAHDLGPYWMWLNTLTNRQSGRQTFVQKALNTDRQAQLKIFRNTDSESQIDRHVHTVRHTDRMGRETHVCTARYTDRDSQVDRHPYIQSKTRLQVLTGMWLTDRLRSYVICITVITVSALTHSPPSLLHTHTISYTHNLLHTHTQTRARVHTHTHTGVYTDRQTDRRTDI